MAVIVNDRDVLLQAASPRVVQVSLPSNVTIDPGQVDGLLDVYDSAKQVILKADSQIFQINKAGTISPSSITVTAVLKNIVGTPVFSATGGTVNVTGSTAVILPANMSQDTMTVSVSLTYSGVTYTDTMTFVKVREGSNAITGLLTNESMVVAADSAGTVASYSSAGGTFKVFDGITDKTTSATFSVVTSSSVTISIVAGTGVYTVTGMSADTGTATLRAVYGGVTIDKLYKIAKSKAGTNGTNGSNGSNGSNGQRGSLTLYASGSSWSDTTANNAITSASGSSTRVIGDTVTISSSSFAATKYWSGSAWVDPGVIINGNLLVNGTASALLFNGVGLKIGTGGSLGGYAFEINSGGIVWADNITGGVIYGDNARYSSLYPVQGVTRFSFYEGVYGLAPSGINAHGVRGKSVYGNSTGIIGAANGYDFYADGGGINYGPFTGSHDCLIPNGVAATLGDIVVDVKCKARRGWSNTIFEVNTSSTPNQKAVVGVLAKEIGPLADHRPAVFIDSWIELESEDGRMSSESVLTQDYEDLKDSYTLYAMNALGEGQINVCGEGGDIEAGDLIVTSSMQGKGMKQADDLVRGCTVAKARESVTFDSPTDVKTIACIYLCG